MSSVTTAKHIGARNLGSNPEPTDPQSPTPHNGDTSRQSEPKTKKDNAKHNKSKIKSNRADVPPTEIVVHHITRRVHPCRPPSAAAAACAAASQPVSMLAAFVFVGFAAIALRSMLWNTFSHAIVRPEW